MSKANDLRARLRSCDSATIGQKDFEDLCIEALTYLFVPPLRPPHIKPRSSAAFARRDAIYPNRNHDGGGNWVQLYKEHKARMIRVEFKHRGAGTVSVEEIVQSREELERSPEMLSIVCSNVAEDPRTHRARHTIYGDEQKVILFITPAHLIEMIAIKERDEDPSDLILDLVELIYVQTSDVLGVFAGIRTGDTV